MRQVYLDNSATTPIKGDVLKEMLPFLTEHFGNASSLYTPGLVARRALDEAREKVAALINAKANEVYFTGCGSESDNWVLKGVASSLKSKGNHIITTVTEHPAMLRTCEYLEKNGYEVTYLGIDDQGRLNPAELEAAIKDTTILVSIMMVNNEIGTIHPIKELAAIAKKHGVLFHTDAVQALGNVPIDVKDLGVDFLSMSAHKIYGPKGVGGLYIRRGAKLGTLIFGGGQESGKRAGTENVAGIVGFGKAAELALNSLDEHIKHSTEIRNYLAEKLTAEIPDVIINGSMDNRHPGNLNVTFKYIEGESILIQLDACGICISTGSACSSKSLKPSHVLSALGVPVELIHGTVRFSVGDFTTKEDIDYTVECTKKVVAWLRDLSPLSPKKGE
ncbi:MAG: cysteine desulfurase NifS [[Eubacterium] sulci]|mgnify:FL=1|jgi:cysteine desulfurase nifS|nr:cysteine desulfurase NifS [[Eubacterium] sulci]MBF1147048.1 cysteine desulfurase NifS [[Eubacterium] sulci]MBF1151639.1 cysteine desulfurase NifS [[Eubacterium] sulci]MBF1153323.1 cysteine desulfurase NifS [[Eubacterium] sulci]MBF1167922.1 cysteine desulfurase NifS [[Eubacterium] sulci]